MRAIFLADDVGNAVQQMLRLPRVLRPAFAGALLGGIAIFFPHIIGVGYETTSAALTGRLVFRDVVIFAIIKAVAVSCCVRNGNKYCRCSIGGADIFGEYFL